MSGQDREPWFRRKRVGFGISPNTWQGWLITALILVGAVVLTVVISKLA